MPADEQQDAVSAPQEPQLTPAPTTEPAVVAPEQPKQKAEDEEDSDFDELDGKPPTALPTLTLILTNMAPQMSWTISPNPRHNPHHHQRPRRPRPPPRRAPRPQTLTRMPS